MCCIGQSWVSLGINARPDRRGPRAVRGMRSCFRRSPSTYLVVFDGEDWAEVVPMRAASGTEIAATYPEATVLENRPVWMSEQEYDRLRAVARDLTTPIGPTARCRQPHRALGGGGGRSLGRGAVGPRRPDVLPGLS